MNLNTLALIPLTSAALLVMPTGPAPESAEGVLEVPESPVTFEVDTRPAFPAEARCRVRSVGLEPSTGLDGRAAGLSSETEWRQKFPRPAGSR